VPDTATGFAPPRRFIRHTADVPIEVRAISSGTPRRQPAINVSEGGLSFMSDQNIPNGTTIEIRIDAVRPPFEARARVVWTREEDGAWCIGVQFLDTDDAFRARMVEQVCAIERYRREVEEREGRTLSRDDAAQEWIAKYAGRFPTG
jgi:c-di-GMP-binding flagellar brake protein YcgR